MSKVEARQKKDKCFVCPDEDEKDAFYQTWTQTIREFANDSRTSVAQMKSAHEEMSAIYERISNEKSASFPDLKTKKRDHGRTNLEMNGNCGNNTPEKPRKKGRR